MKRNSDLVVITFKFIAPVSPQHLDPRVIPGVVRDFGCRDSEHWDKVQPQADLGALVIHTLADVLQARVCGDVTQTPGLLSPVQKMQVGAFIMVERSWEHSE